MLAGELRTQATHELEQRLHSPDRSQADVIGFITAAGALSLNELAELTGQPRYALAAMVGSVFGRSLESRPHADTQLGADPVLLFAHQTLQATAEEYLAYDLAAYRQRIHAWADTYRERQWPAGTPQYLLRPYGRLLAATGDVRRLAELAADPARHDRMLAESRGDADALAEIGATQRLLADQPEPDLAALGLLAARRAQLIERNIAMPPKLPALWVKLGDPRKGEALVRSITDPGERAWALAALAEALAQAQLWADAERVANTITDDSDQQIRALISVIEALARAHLPDHAERIARGITDNPIGQTKALAALVAGLADTDPPRTAQLAAEAERTARNIAEPREWMVYDTDPTVRGQALASLVNSLARAHLWEQAERVARSITDDPASDFELSRLEFERDQALIALVAELAAANMWDDARRITRSIAEEPVPRESLSDPNDPFAGFRFGHPNKPLSDRAFVAFAEALAKAHRWDELDRILRIADRTVFFNPGHWRSRVLVEELARAHRWDDAERTARSMGDESSLERAEALAIVVKAMVTVDPRRAARLATEAERIARKHLDPAPAPDPQAVEGFGFEDLLVVDRSINKIGVQAFATVAEALAGIDRPRAAQLIADVARAPYYGQRRRRINRAGQCTSQDRPLGRRRTGRHCRRRSLWQHPSAHSPDPAADRRRPLG